LELLFFVKLKQSLNAAQPISVTLLGMLMLVNPVQQLNASASIDLTLFGIVILVSPKQKANALSPITVTPFGIVISPPEPLYFMSTPFSMVKSFAADAAGHSARIRSEANTKGTVRLIIFITGDLLSIQLLQTERI